MLILGSIVSGRYRIIRWLGGGGMGAVYLAADLRLSGRQLAVKQLVSDPSASPAELAQAAQQFQAEATLLAALDHSNLPKVYDCFTEAGQSYLVMEYVDGVTLEDILDRTPGPIPEAQVLAWAAQLCDVLTYLHGRQPPVIFRDLKPANIMLDRNDVIQLIDFGIARIFKPGQRTDTLRMGTLGYAPPEQFAGHGQTDAQSDIYSLGVTLHYLLTRRDPAQYPPFSAASIPLRGLNPTISPRTEAAVMKALAYNPTSRFQSAAEMKLALFGAAGTQPVGSLPAPRPTTLRAMPWVLAILVMGASIIAAVARSQPPQPNPALPPGMGRPTEVLTVPPSEVEVPTATVPLSPIPIAATLRVETPMITATPEPTATSLPSVVEPPPPLPPPAATTSSPRDMPEDDNGRTGMVAFHSDRTGDNEIYLMRADGSDIRRLTYEPGNDMYPALARDGTRVAFVSERDGNPEIYVVNIADGRQTRLTYDSAEDRLPVWAPDGTRIAFNSARAGNLDLYVTNPDGSNVIQLTGGSERDGHATWSPDGNRLAFNSGVEKDDWEIYIMPAGGGVWVRLTMNSVMDWSPSWSPADNRILYLTWRSSKTVLATIAATGGEPHILPTVMSGIWGAAWSPGGQYVAFTSNETGRDEIYIIAADGREVRQITFDGGAYPSWSW